MTTPSPPSWTIRGRRARGDGGQLKITEDADRVSAHLEDSAHFPGGHATEIAVPLTEADVADAIRTARSVLPIGAQSSLTGGATPMGERLVSVSRLNRIEWLGSDSVRVEAGVTLMELDAALAAAGRYYPPGPTFTGATVGGMVATNAAGAATFKYGTTRNWVSAVTVVLPAGDVLDVERGSVRAHPEGFFEFELVGGPVSIPTPTYQMPSVPKLSAGYFSSSQMDLVDLFVGSEGTLGFVSAATLRVLPTRPRFCLTLVQFNDRPSALHFVRTLREAAVEHWTTHGARGVDISAIEYMDSRALSILREDSVDGLRGVTLPPRAEAALLITQELPPGTTSEEAFTAIGAARDSNAPDTPLGRLCAMLDRGGVFDEAAVAVPGDAARAGQLLAVREAVPEGVNRRIAERKQTVDDAIEKVAADVIVPFDRLADLFDAINLAFAEHRVEGAVWGHVSDGNLHANVLPRSRIEVEAGKAAVLAIGREAIRLGGAPLAEHGVGRNAVKQQLLRDLYGSSGIEEMRRVKRAVDPEWKMAPGVLFRQ